MLLHSLLHVSYALGIASTVCYCAASEADGDHISLNEGWNRRILPDDVTELRWTRTTFLQVEILKIAKS